MESSDAIWRKAILTDDLTIGDAISNLDSTSLKIIMVVNQFGVLDGTVSDGDIRRGLLKGLDLKCPISKVVHKNALVVPSDVSRELVMQIMVANKIQQIPVVNDQHHVVGLHLWDEISAPPVRSNLMVIMAGGMGIRLRPFTENCPKPLLEVSGKPMLQHIIERAKLEGFSRFVIVTHYLGHMIQECFGNGKKLGVEIEYVSEKSPLGTAGGLSLISPLPEEPFIVTNGDVITDIRYGELIDFHVRHAAIATMSVRAHEWQHPFGVVQMQGVEIIGIEEKPIFHSYINAGVYVLDPSALKVINLNERCDMPILFERLKSNSMLTVAYPMHEPWLDVGRKIDLDLANNLINPQVN